LDARVSKNGGRICFSNRREFVAGQSIKKGRNLVKHENMEEEPLHELAQRLPDMRSIAGLEKQEAHQLLSNQDTQDAMEAMLSRLFGRPLDFDLELDLDLNGGTMVSMLLVSLSARSCFTPWEVAGEMSEQAKRFTAEFMRLADVLAVPDETVAEHLGEFVAVYEAKI
jgi:hypothetical protein